MLDHLPIASRVLPDAIERNDAPLYPMETLREALANAFCHRDYSISGGSVGIAMFDDRLEITSTGTPPPGITLADLTQPHVSKLHVSKLHVSKLHVSKPRNDLIADAFYKRGIIEQWGRGTLKIVEVTEGARSPVLRSAPHRPAPCQQRRAQPRASALRRDRRRLTRAARPRPPARSIEHCHQHTLPSTT